MGASITKTVGDVLRYLDGRAPRSTAEDWDNVGLLVGDPAQELNGAVLSIDLTLEAIEVANQKKYPFIINHHPCIFPKNRGPSTVTSGSLVYEAAKRGISVAAYHTNFDQCSFEVVQAISQGLGVVPKGRLVEKSSGSLVKLVTFVPPTHLDAVRNAICDAGAGHQSAQLTDG